MSPRIVEVRQAVLKKNDVLARELRARFGKAEVFVTNLVSGPGAGKTALLERTLRELRADFRVAALVGDLATDNDAQRLERSGALVRQITTGTVCHLDAEMIDAALHGWELASFDFLFLENVGNLVCPSSYDLGESMRVVLHAVTEGEDKPLKYPTIYNSADVALITKIDLAVAVEFDRALTYRNMRAVRPDIEILECSARTGAGMEGWLSWLREGRARSRASAPVPTPKYDGTPWVSGAF
jgi:hydrogenase nickel incorporation protein HypB